MTKWMIDTTTKQPWVIVHLSEPTAYFSPQEARDIAASLLKHADEAEREGGVSEAEGA